MKSLIVFTLAAVACFYIVKAGEVSDENFPDEAVVDPKSELDVPAKNEEVKDETKDEAPRSVDEKNEVPAGSAPIMQSETKYSSFVMKDGKVLENKKGGERTVMDKDGNVETTKFGDFP